MIGALQRLWVCEVGGFAGALDVWFLPSRAAEEWVLVAKGGDVWVVRGSWLFWVA